MQRVALDGPGHLTLPDTALELTGTPARAPVRHPALGEWTGQVLHELGYPPQRISELRAAGITRNEL